MKKQIRSALRAAGRHRRVIAMVVLPAVLLGVNVPPALAFVQDLRYQMLIDSPEYQAVHGRWDLLELPPEVQVNAVHAALLPTGKLLIIAGSGNNEKAFDSGTFKTLLYDPATGQSRIIMTPDDVFCGGHAFLPDGKLLVAGGTQRYEVLEPDVTRAAGAMIVKNESPNKGHSFEKGTEFATADGRVYLATAAFDVPPAVKTEAGRRGAAKVTASETTVWVESPLDGAAGVTSERGNYKIRGLTGEDAENVYGLAEKMTMEKQDFQGIADTYEFDPFTEEYVKVGDMVEKRWYPSLLGLPDGGVLAVSGLDGTGQIVPGDNEVYDPRTKTWTDRPDLFQYFPTYPALFQSSVPGRVFYSGSSTGYGSETEGRTPGFWNLEGNTFEAVPGLRDPDMMETSGSAFAGPVQEQKLIVVGGGGIGESTLSTPRIDVIDLDAPQPAFTPGPDLPAPTRYPNVVQLPDDRLLISNGSRDYRGRSATNNLLASLYDPATNTLAPAAAPTVGRNYHSAGILLPNGQVLTMGGDSLFKDELNLKPGEFEKRLEIFTPPYLLQGKPQPVITDAPQEVQRGATMTVATPDAARITKARLLRPSAATHATDLEQRSIALDIAPGAGSLELTVPDGAALVPPGYYMLFLTDDAGVPSVGRWVQVT